MKLLFSISVFVMSFGLLVSCGETEDTGDETVTLHAYFAQKKKCDSLDILIQSQLQGRLRDSVLNDTATMQMMILEDEARIVFYRLDRIMREYIATMSGGVPVPDTGDVYTMITDLSDTDKSTSFFVGEQPEKPSGAGLQLYDDLARFGSKLHPDVTFFIPQNHTEEDKVQWVKDSFYHATTADVLVRLQLYRQNVLEALKKSFDNELLQEAK
jgi:hypothetical protein